MIRRLLAGAFLLLLGTPLALEAQVADSSRSVPAERQILRPGDLVRLSIWREPEMSGDFQVDEAGVVVFPRLGRVMVRDFTPELLKSYLLEEYGKFLRNPSIEIVVLRRVRIMGAVRDPGLYPVDPTVTIADALALAGGATPIGHQDRVRIIREGVELTTVLSAATLVGDSPIRSGDVLFVPERSWLSRNSGVVAATIGATVSLMIAFFVR